MKIQHQTAQRLVVTHQRGLMAWVLAAFTFLSVFLVISLIVQAIPRLPAMNIFQRLSWVLWIGMAAGFGYFGLMAWLNAGRGITCTFDHTTDEAHILRPKLWRTDDRALSIYAISGVRVEYNDDARVFGVFLVLHSSERIPIATVAPHSVDDARRTADTIEDFLRQPHPA
jgi:hypothetical protein